MPEYPDNSHSARENTSPPSKRVEKVVNGTAKTRKQSEVKKFAGIFMPDEVGDVKTFIITDVVIPGLKNAIADVVSIVLFGEAGRIGTRKNAGSKVSYQRYYDDPRRDDRRNYNQRSRPVAGFEFDDIIFDNRGDADLVLDQLESAIANYGMASVLDRSGPDRQRPHNPEWRRSARCPQSRTGSWTGRRAAPGGRWR